MKQLFFVTLSLTKGGAERVITNMCNDFFAGCCQVTVISLMCAKAEYPLADNIRFVTVDERETDAKKSMPVRFLARRKKLKSLLLRLMREEGRPDCIISFLPEPNMIMCSLRRSLGVPLIISVRNDPQTEYASPLKYAMMRLLYKKSDGYVFQTEQAADYFAFSQHIRENATVIPNPLAREFLCSPDVKNTLDTGKASEPYRIIAVGRLERQKNYPLLLEVFAAFHEAHPDSMLTIYGEGSEREALEQTLDEKRLQECVFLPGNTDKIREELLQADVYLMTSRYEGMPNTLMEAMAMELPVIVSDCPCGGPAYLIRDGENGFLIPMDDGQKEGFLEKLAFLWSRPEAARRIAKEAGKIRETLAPEKIYQTWDSYLEQIRQQAK